MQALKSSKGTNKYQKNTAKQPGGVRDVQVKRFAVNDKDYIQDVSKEFNNSQTKFTENNLPANDPKYGQTIDEQFNDSYGDAGIQPHSLDESGAPKKSKPKAKKSKRRKKPRFRNSLRGFTNKKKKKASVTERIGYRALVVSVNPWITAFGLFIWQFLQVPLAIFNAAFLGLSSIASFFEPSVDEGFLTGIAKKAVSAYLDYGAWLWGTVGVDLSAFNPANMYMYTQLIMLMLAAINFLGIYFIYKLLNINSVGGRVSWLKMSCIGLGLLGYMLPISNLLPWFLPWIIVVSFFPR